MIIDRNEALEYIGGAGITAALVSAVNSLVKTMYGIGQDLGYALKSLFGRC